MMSVTMPCVELVGGCDLARRPTSESAPPYSDLLRNRLPLADIHVLVG